MNTNNKKAWLYLLPATLFLAAFLVYPLIDVFIYSVEEGYNFASQTYFGTGTYNFSYVLHDPYFLQALKKYVYFGDYHGTGIHRAGASDFGGVKLHQASAGALPDGVFSAVCDEHAGRRPCVYDSVSEDRVYGWSGESDDKLVRRGSCGFY